MAKDTGNNVGAAMMIHRHRGLILPLAVAGLIFVVLVPVPPALMNVLLVGNITLAALILLTTINVGSPLEFSVFPSLLLVSTLVRLVLNVATTRLILTAGEGGRSIQEAQLAAGQVIWAFSQFVTAGSLEVGVIIFLILTVIQFVVITKGATRISEVAARFMLDAMPGKQMAIDADLSAGLMTAADAHARREIIARQADFYGAMDGASKFVRGDAVAAVLITFVNILGGLYIGLVRYHWSPTQTFSLFTRLTIGDGLVAQIPAFIISVSAALVVTRSASSSNLSEEVVSQLISRPRTLAITAAFLALLTLTSLPKTPLLLVGIGCAGLAWMLYRKRARLAEVAADGAKAGEQASGLQSDGSGGASLEPLLKVDPLRIDLGYSLVPLVDAAMGGDLMERIAQIRREVASDLGMLVPPVRVVDDMSIEAGGYVLAVRGVKVASGKLRPRRLLATGGEDAAGRLAGLEGYDPITAMPGLWIGKAQHEQAASLNYIVRSASQVLAEHLGTVIRLHAAELLTRRQAARLLENARPSAPEAVDEAMERFGLARIHRLLQSLLAEGVSVRDLETILETLCDQAGRTEDVEELASTVRRAMSRALAQKYCSDDGKLWCVSLDPALTDEIRGQAGQADGLYPAGGSPARARRISEALADGLSRLTRHGRHPVLLCEPGIRAPVRKMIAPLMPQAAVLAYNEVGSAEVQSVGSVGIE